MHNFRIEVSLNTPVILTRGYMTLDALLAYAILQETDSLERAHTEIPLERTGDIWHGSAAFFCQHVEMGHAPFGRSLKLDDLEYGPWQRLDKNNRPIFVDQSRDVERYQWLPRFNTYNTVFAPPSASDFIVHWFGRGDMDRVIRLLQSLPGIGKKSMHGWGQIHKVRGYEIDRDRSLWLDDGLPARPLPESMAPGRKECLVLLEPFQPPYFSSPKAPCVVPASRFIDDDLMYAIAEGD